MFTELNKSSQSSHVILSGLSSVFVGYYRQMAGHVVPKSLDTLIAFVVFKCNHFIFIMISFARLALHPLEELKSPQFSFKCHLEH